jgi:hypothetical protein
MASLLRICAVNPSTACAGHPQTGSCPWMARRHLRDDERGCTIPSRGTSGVEKRRRAAGTIRSPSLLITSSSTGGSCPRWIAAPFARSPTARPTQPCGQNSPTTARCSSSCGSGDKGAAGAEESKACLHVRHPHPEAITWFPRAALTRRTSPGTIAPPIMPERCLATIMEEALRCRVMVPTCPPPLLS